MFDAPSSPDDYGIYRCPDGGLMLSNVLAMPDVTPEMFDWWFAWHGLDTMRYIIWDKDDHYYCQTRDVEHTLDSSLSMKERYWNTTHDVQEALLDGDDPIPVVIPAAGGPGLYTAQPFLSWLRSDPRRQPADRELPVLHHACPRHAGA